MSTRRTDPYRNFPFRVRIDGVVVAGASKLTGLKRTTQVGGRDAAGTNPERESIELERGLTHDAGFMAWASGEGRETPKDLTVDIHDEAGRMVLRYTVFGCRVATFQALPDLESDATAVRIERLVIEHDGWERVDIEPEPEEPFSEHITAGLEDASGRAVTLRPVGEDWRAVADVRPTDAQREFVFPMAARYLLMTEKGGPWTSLGIHADDQVVGHVMWGLDDDGSHWIGGLVIDQTQQGRGLGRATTRTLMAWLAQQPGHWTTRLTHHPTNAAAARLYADLGFTPTGEVDEDGEIVLEIRP